MVVEEVDMLAVAVVPVVSYIQRMFHRGVKRLLLVMVVLVQRVIVLVEVVMVVIHPLRVWILL